MLSYDTQISHTPKHTERERERASPEEYWEKVSVFGLRFSYTIAQLGFGRVNTTTVPRGSVTALHQKWYQSVTKRWFEHISFLIPGRGHKRVVVVVVVVGGDGVYTIYFYFCQYFLVFYFLWFHFIPINFFQVKSRIVVVFRAPWFSHSLAANFVFILPIWRLFGRCVCAHSNDASRIS